MLTEGVFFLEEGMVKQKARATRMPQMWDSLMHATRMLEESKYGSIFNSTTISPKTRVRDLEKKNIYALYEHIGSTPPLLQIVDYTPEQLEAALDDETIGHFIKTDNSAPIDGYQLLEISYDSEKFYRLLDDASAKRIGLGKK